MAEEHGFEAPEGHNLCRNNCGFFGIPATQNFCSKCFKEVCLKEEQQQKQPNSDESPADNSMFAPSSSVPPPDVLCSPAISSPGTEPVIHAPVVETTAAVEHRTALPNRCSVCRKRVGLTGFRCRCGLTCCGGHRFPEQHGCSFDFKAMGREAIAKANPVVRAAKLDKI